MLMDTSALEAFAADEESGPFRLLTLLRYTEQARYPTTSDLSGLSGEDAYQRYFEQLRPLIEAAEGVVEQFDPISGVVLGDLGKPFDALSIVRYPSRSALMAMLGSFAYTNIAIHRVASLDDSVVLVIPGSQAPA